MLMIAQSRMFSLALFSRDLSAHVFELQFTPRALFAHSLGASRNSQTDHTFHCMRVCVCSRLIIS